MASRSMTVLLIVLLIASLGPAFARAGSEGGPSRTIAPNDSPDVPPFGYFKGTLPVPFDGQSIEEAYTNASKHSQFVPVWGRPTPFYDMASELSGPWGEMFVEDMVRGNGMFPLMHLSFYDEGLKLVEPPGMTGSNLSSEDWRRSYHDSAMDVLNASRPLYMSIGNEVNRWYEVYGATPGTENSFLDYISLYNVIYDDIKALSPATKVFCTFSREVVSENREADLSVLSLLDPDRMDLLVLTSYPFCLAGVDDVSDLSDDYYSRVFDHIKEMPLGFSELGWPTEGPFGGEEGQASFIRNVTRRLTVDNGVDLELFGWAWLTDLTTSDSIGLLNRSGGEKEGFKAWIDNRAPFYERDNRSIALEEDFGEYTYDLSRTFSDPDPWDVLQYQVWNGTDYSAWSNSTTLSARIEGGGLVLSTARNWSGMRQFRIRAEDWGGLSVWTLIQVQVAQVNDPPSIGDALEGLLVIVEDDYRFYDMEEYLQDDQDALGDMNMSVISSPFLVVTVDLSKSPYMTIYTEEPDWYGNTYLHFSVTDSAGLSTARNISVVVKPQNDPPILNCPPFLGTDEDVPVSRDITNWVTDVDPGDPLYREAESSDPENVSIRFNGTVMTLVPARNWHGTMVVELTVSDGKELESSPFTFQVASVNDPPEATAPANRSILEDGTFDLDLYSLYPFDPDGDRLTWTVSGFGPIFRSAVVQANGTLRVEAHPNANGRSNVTLLLDDGSGGRLELVQNLEVVPVNDPPVLLVPSPWTVSVVRGRSVEIVLYGEDYGTEDPDDPLSSLSLIALSENCRVKGFVVNITVPSDLMLDRFAAAFVLRDPHGALSEERELLVSVLNGSGQMHFRIRVTDVWYDLDDGVVSIYATGDPGQTFWVVLKGGEGAGGSYRMVESPLGSGQYGTTVEGIVFKDGEVVTYHLSLTEGGPNDSLVPASSFTYVGEEGDGDGPFDGTSLLPIAIMVVSILALLALGGYLLLRRDKGRMPLERSVPIEE